MKFASYSDGSRDGELLLVSRDLHTAVYTAGIASRLQQVLDDWNFLAPQLQALYSALNQGRVSRAFAFEPARCMAPMPRVHELAELVCAHGLWHTQPVSAARLQGPTQPVWTGASLDVASSQDGTSSGSQALVQAGAEAANTALGAGVLAARLGWAAVLAEVPRGASPEQCLESVRLLLAVQRWTAGVEDTCLTLSCAPVALTPDEWGEDWQRGCFKARVALSVGGKRLPAAKQAPVLEGPAAEEWAVALARACRLHTLGPGTVMWAGLAGPLPALEKLDRDSEVQWSFHTSQGLPGFGVCAPVVDPRPTVLQQHADPQAQSPH